MTGPRVVALVVALMLVPIVFSATPRVRFSRTVRSAAIVSAVVLLLVAAYGLSAPRAFAARGWLMMTGGLVDVGGYRLRIECQGTGSPTVVMDAGLAQTRATWGRVPAGVAEFTRVCTYDRAGLGESDVGPAPRTSEQMVNELHRLLANAGIGGPYVLVGHSFGGFNVRLFATRYPTEVAGLVLAAASHEDQIARFAELMPSAEREAYLNHERGDNFERVDVEASSVEVRAAGPLPEVPIVVIAPQPSEAPTDARSAAAEMQLQKDLSQLSPTARLVVAENSGHFVQLDRPDLVIGAVRDVVLAAPR